MKEKNGKIVVALREYEFPYIESFLMDMARKGKIFVKFDGEHAVFRSGDPVERRYRMVPKRKKHVTEEERYLIQKKGWEFVCVRGDLILIYTDDAEAEELQISGASLRRKSRSLLYLWIAAGIALVAFTFFAYMQMPDGAYGPAGLFVLVVLIGYYGWIQVTEPKMCADLIDRGNIDHNIPYEEKLTEAERRYSRFWIVLGALIVFVLWLMKESGII